MEPVIVVHGGAWAIPDHLAKASRIGVKLAAKGGYTVLKSGRSAIDAVEAAVNILEDDPAFDAGTGSVLNSKGEVEMDAVIMDGKTLKAGAVAAVQDIANPVSLARLVMDKSDHTLIVGTGANEFAANHGVKTKSKDELVTEEAKREYEHFLKFKTVVDVSFRNRAEGSGHDTVGAVALDVHGNVAFATSTGGITAKQPGRVGDSPIIGSGGYCDNFVGAVSTTGHGESISKTCLAHRILMLIQQGMGPKEAVSSSLLYMKDRVSGSGGVILVTAEGEIVQDFSTERMAWASIKCGQLSYGLNPDELNKENL